MLMVYKYILGLSSYVDLSIPEGAKILTVQTQHGRPCMWALVNPNNTMVARRFHMAGTGNTIPEDPESLVYINTFQEMNGAEVYHLFEITTKKD